MSCTAQKPILIKDYSNLHSVNGKALSSGGVGCAFLPAPPAVALCTSKLLSLCVCLDCSEAIQHLSHGITRKPDTIF
jgi:hypothetical protein